MTKPRRRKPHRDHAERLLAALLANLEHTTDPALRLRLQAAIESLRRKQEAA
jgi:hypothetical protein